VTCLRSQIATSSELRWVNKFGVWSLLLLLNCFIVISARACVCICVCVYARVCVSWSCALYTAQQQEHGFAASCRTQTEPLLQPAWAQAHRFRVVNTADDDCQMSHLIADYGFLREVFLSFCLPGQIYASHRCIPAWSVEGCFAWWITLRLFKASCLDLDLERSLRENSGAESWYAGLRGLCPYMLGTQEQVCNVWNGMFVKKACNQGYLSCHNRHTLAHTHTHTHTHTQQTPVCRPSSGRGGFPLWSSTFPTRASGAWPLPW